MKNSSSEFKDNFSKTWALIIGKISPPLGKACAYLMLCLLVILSVVLILILFGFLTPKVEALYLHHYALSEIRNEEISVLDKRQIDYLIGRHQIVPMSSIYEKTLEYYDSLISVLVALLGLFAFIAWFSLRTKARNEVKEEFDRYIGGDAERERILKATREIFDENSDEFANIWRPQITEEVTENVINGLKKQKETERLEVEDSL